MLFSAVIVIIRFVPFVSTCTWNTFVRDSAIVDKTTNTPDLRIQNGTDSQGDCAILCFQTNLCVSFFYNSVSRICRLRSDTTRAEDVTLQTDIGYHYFRVPCPTIKTDNLTSTHIETSNVDGVVTMNVTCSTDYSFIGQSNVLQCDGDGLWPKIVGSCSRTHWLNPSSFAEPIPGALHAGANITFTARQHATGDIWAMNLHNDSGVIALHMTVGVSDSVGLDTFTDRWSNFYTDTTTQPFPPYPSVFTCSVQVTEARYQVLVNGVSFITYNHVIPELWTITTLSFSGSIQLLEVDMQL
ncbi:uncharacterized protein LOC124287541 [Haliotis rubra]|uniref:uncharacterized protein LOC124287541 n=1 Tax=Haliotis rubra TaxID=36100 RepID=UPI001EE560C9|nr:uncharacterized protein LOC124287541 [Haliotis rubra]